MSRSPEFGELVKDITRNNLIGMRLTFERAVVGAMLVLSLITLGLQAFVLRPRLWSPDITLNPAVGS